MSDNILNIRFKKTAKGLRPLNDAELIKFNQFIYNLEDNQEVEGFDNNVQNHMQNQQKAQIERQQQQIDALMELMKQVRPIYKHTHLDKGQIKDNNADNNADNVAEAIFYIRF